jgi:ligand-binding sensor domain-containing protein
MKKICFVALCILMIGIGNFAKAQFTNYDTVNSDLPSNYVCGGVAIDTNNNVWVGTDAGVAKFNGTNWTIYTTADGLPVDIIACITVDKYTNDIWIGTDGDGVAKFDGSIWTKYAYADGLCDNGIHYIAVDADSSIWFGSWGAGVSKLHDTTWTTYTDADGFPSDGGAIASVYYICTDALNNKWFGTDLGLVKYNNTIFTTINQTNTPDLKSNCITAVAIDDGNNKWLGVLAKGVAKLNSSDLWVANYDTLNGICNDGITDVKIDSEGNIWFGEYTKYGSLIKGGITKFNGTNGTGISLKETDGLINEQVFRIAVDDNDDIWVATGDGLSKYHDTGIGIKENNNTISLNLYPNPAHEYLNMDVEINSGIAQISDITGRIISVQTVSSPVKINIQNLINGLYFINVTESDKIYNGKFIKE